MITIIIDNAKCKLSNLFDKEILSEIDERLSFDVQNFKFMKTNNRWDGKYRLLTRNLYFPIGMLKPVESILRKNGCTWNSIDNRVSIEYGSPIPLVPGTKYKARDYQSRAISTCIKKGSGIVRMCTGSGKSFVISSLIAHYNTKSIIYVVSIDLLYQMVETLRESYGIEAGIIGDGNCDIKDVNVMTIWTAATAFNKKIERGLAEDIKIDKSKLKNKARVRELVRTAGVIVLDECQFAGSSSFQLLSRESHSARNRFLFSGTPWRESGDDMLLEAVAGGKILDINASFLIKKGFLVKPIVMFKDVSIMRKVGKTYNEVYSKYIINNEERNGLAISACRSFEKRGEKVLILIRNINHGKIILDKLTDLGIECLFLNGSKNSKERNDGIEKIKSGEIRVVIASTIFDIGIDIPSLSVLINLGGGKSTGKVLQRIGRVIRASTGKNKAYVIDFYDQCKYLRDHSQVRFRTANSESEFEVERIRNK